MSGPRFRIETSGRDVTGEIAASNIALSIKDEAGTTSDTLELTISDPNGQLAPPRKGQPLRPHIGYGEALRDMGEFIIDEVRVAGPPDIITVSAKAADFLGALKARKTRNWTGQTIGEIVKTIADEHGLTPAVDGVYKAYPIKHRDQTDESDLNFLTRLAADIGAVAKPLDGRLVFANKGQAKATSGMQLPVTALAESELVTWEVTNAERGQYGQIIARWRDNETAETKSITLGNSDGTSQPLPRIYESEALATSAAEAALKRIRQSEAKLSASVPGRVDLQAEGPLELSHRRADVAGRWIVQRVTHSMSGSGFVSHFEAERPA